MENIKYSNEKNGNLIIDGNFTMATINKIETIKEIWIMYIIDNGNITTVRVKNGFFIDDKNFVLKEDIETTSDIKEVLNDHIGNGTIINAQIRIK